MKDVRNLAIQELINIGVNSMDKVVLCKMYGVANWLAAGYKELAEREKTISESGDEGEILGGKTVVKMCRLREKDIRVNLPNGCDAAMPNRWSDCSRRNSN